MPAPAIERLARRAGRVPRAVTADRGDGEAAVEDESHAIGVRHVVLPRKGRPNAQRDAISRTDERFKKTVRWRTGCTPQGTAKGIVHPARVTPESASKSTIRRPSEEAELRFRIETAGVGATRRCCFDRALPFIECDRYSQGWAGVCQPHDLAERAQSWLP